MRVRTLAICGSMVFIDEMEDLAKRLEELGYSVSLPQREEQRIDWNGGSLDQLAALKKEFVDEHLEKIRRSDVVLLANYEKRGIAGYVGPNTLMEAAFGYALGVPVVLLFDAPDQPCSVELTSVVRMTLGGDIERLQEV